MGERHIHFLREKGKSLYNYFRSRKLVEILQNMGLRQGFIHTQPVNDLMSNMFPGGYREARRIYYLLESVGWITYEPPLILYVAVYSNGTGGFKIEDVNKKVLVEVNYNPEKAVEIIRNIALPN